MSFKKTDAAHFAYRINCTNALCGKTAQILGVTEGAIYNYHWDLNFSCGMGNLNIMKFLFTVRTVCCCRYDGSSCSLL